MKLSDILIPALAAAGKTFVWKAGIGENNTEIMFSTNGDWSTNPNIDINNSTNEFSIGSKVWKAADPKSIKDFIDTVCMFFP